MYSVVQESLAPRMELSEPPIKAKKLHVLVVEDDPNDQYMIMRALEKSRAFDAIAVTSVFSVDTARVAIGCEQFDVVISDFCLHGDCGADLFQMTELRPEKTATILITGMPTPEVTAYAKAAGAMLCLSKDELTTDVLDEALITATDAATANRGEVSRPTTPTMSRTERSFEHPAAVM